jgi:hypothetical protein
MPYDESMLQYMLLPLSLFALRQAPVGTELHVRLVTPVGSYASKAGSSVSGMLIAPVAVGDQTILPEGSMLSGSVQRVGKIGFGILHETATLVLNFNEVTLPNGETFRLATRLTDVDNSRERVIPDGSIQGVRSTASISYRFSGYIRTALLWEVHARLAFWAIKTLLVRVPEPEIYYPSGVELTLALSEPAYGQPQPESAELAGRLSEEARDVLEPMVDDMPVRTRAQNSGRESDLVNMMFIGSREEISRAFVAAGWTQATTKSMRSRYLGVRAFVEGEGYHAFPMSVLLLNDEAPDMFWQKGLNDVTKRHHIRVWKQAETWNGEQIWIGAATRDVDFAYMRHRQAVTHKIEEDIDRERDKIVHDFEFTSCADVADYVERPHVPQFTHNATSDPMETDARIAVVHLNECNAPHVTKWVGEPLPMHGNPFQRLARRQILSIRSDFYRQNPYFRSYEGARWLVTTIHNHRHRNDPERDSAPATSDPAAEGLLARALNSSWGR